MTTRDATRRKVQISRVRRSKREAQNTYDRLSTVYDLLAEPSEREYREIGLKKLELQTGESALEIGPGTGGALVAMAPSVGASGHAWGIDLSMGMCRRAQSRLASTGLGERAALCQRDALHLPFRASSFEALFCSFTLELFDTPQIPRVLGECRRVLKGEGRICVVALSKVRGTWMTGLYEWMHDRFPAYLDCRPIYLQTALEEADFQSLDAAEETMWGLGVEVVLARPAPPRSRA
jgi:ubiquinone/menaquinone biosynthesis C-methylase UbiE